jgi:hypothetical protein
VRPAGIIWQKAAPCDQRELPLDKILNQRYSHLTSVCSIVLLLLIGTVLVAVPLYPISRPSLPQPYRFLYRNSFP